MSQNLRALLGAVAFSAAVFCASSPASAQTVTDHTAGAQTGGYYVNAGSNAGQSFTVPSGVQAIQSVSIGVGRAGAVSTVRVRLRTFTSPGVFGSTDIATTTADTSAVFSATDQIVLTVPGGRPVSAGEKYIILVEDVAAGNSATVTTIASGYPGGDFFPYGSSIDGDARFSVTYQDVVATPVPTMSEWAMILFGAVLAGCAALYVQQRRLTA